MVRGKNINLYLMDGDAAGRMKCTLSNWTGIVYKIPRTRLERLRDREDLKYSGVYFLFGKSEEGDSTVYIGQAGVRKNGKGVLSRVSEHLINGKIEFNEAVLLTTQNNSFGPTEISFLENKFTSLAKGADRYQIINSNDPTLGNVTEEKQSELEDFLDYSKLVIGVLGYKLFMSLDKSHLSNEDNDNEEEVFFLTRKIRRTDRTINATCKRTSEGYVVLKGSEIEEMNGSRIPDSIRLLREEYLEKNLIINGVLQKSVLFASPSYAASFVVGMHTNGRSDWRTDEGISLNEYEFNLKEKIEEKTEINTH